MSRYKMLRDTSSDGMLIRVSGYLPQQCLYFLGLPSSFFAPHGQGSLRPILTRVASCETERNGEVYAFSRGARPLNSSRGVAFHRSPKSPENTRASSRSLKSTASKIGCCTSE